MKLFNLLLLVISFSLFGESFELISKPEKAFVFLKKNGDEKARKIGETPLKLSLGELKRLVGKDMTYQVTVKKQGYDEFNINMLKTEKSKVKLDVKLNINKEIVNIKKHDNLVSELFKIQALIRASNFSGAISQLNNLEKDYKAFSVVSELKGIAYYMQKDINKALSMFRSAFAKNAQNRDAYKMKVYLEKKLGLDVSQK